MDRGGSAPLRGAGLALVLCVAAPGSLARAEASCLPAGQTAEVATVLDDLDLALDDGRVLRLAGIDPARATAERPQLGRDARIAVDHWLSGARVDVQTLAGAADRWDRWPALVSVSGSSRPTAPDVGAAGPGEAVSVNAALIAMGWARARPETAVHACFASFLAGEAEARRTSLGLWADPYYAIVAASDAAGLALRSGSMALVDGHVELRNGRAGVLVRLGGARSGLAATVSRRAEKSLAKAGLDLQKLGGAEIRIRGVLDDRFGPRIDLVDADQVEWVGGPRATNGMRPSSGAGEPETDH